jgi:hypothetical protein
MLQALHAMADHLPVVADFAFDFRQGYNAMAAIPAFQTCSLENVIVSEGIANCELIEIRNSLGMLVPCDRENDLPISSLAPGLYFIRYKNSKCFSKFAVLSQ